MEKISVIIPIYNAEKYLKKCIESVLNQTIDNYEIILINDESKDNSLKIMKDYEKKYDNIVVINQKNKGPGLTRNVGIENSTGKYIMFIDSDDYIDEDYLQVHYDSIKDTDYDVVMSGFRKVSDNRILYERRLSSKEFSKYLVTGPVSKIYKKEFLEKNNIRFENINVSEDVIFNMNVIKNNAKIKTINYIGYNYVCNNESLTNTLNKGFDDRLSIIDFFNKINYKDIENKEIHQYYIIRHVIYYLLENGRVATCDNFLEQHNKLFKWMKENLENYYKNKYLILRPKGEYFKVHVVVVIYVLIVRLKMVKLFSRLYCKGK